MEKLEIKNNIDISSILKNNKSIKRKFAYPKDDANDFFVDNKKYKKKFRNYKKSLIKYLNVCRY